MTNPTMTQSDPPGDTAREGDASMTQELIDALSDLVKRWDLDAVKVQDENVSRPYSPDSCERTGQMKALGRCRDELAAALRAAPTPAPTREQWQAAVDYIELLESCQDGYYRASESGEANRWKAIAAALSSPVGETSKRKPFTMNVSREWVMKMAALEAENDVRVGGEQSETAWLIERDIDSMLHYWTGRVIDGREIGAWSVNHLDARRFARREDAACMLTWHCGGNGRVAEHMWSPVGETPAPTPHVEISRHELDRDPVFIITAAFRSFVHRCPQPFSGDGGNLVLLWKRDAKLVGEPPATEGQ